MSPLVSLIITTYNRQTFLGQAIASVLRQSYHNIELIVWDDGSQDESVALAQRYAALDARVRVIAAPHTGRVHALAAAIAQARGQYLGWVDSDDWLHPDAIAETVLALENQPQAGFVYTDYLEVDPAGAPLRSGRRCSIPYSAERLLVDFMTFHFRLLRREAFDRVGGINLAMETIEDYELCLRLSEVAPVVHLAKPLYYYRLHPDSITAQQSERQFALSRRAIAAALKRRGLTKHYRLETNPLTRQFHLRRKSVATLPQAAAVVGTVASSLMGLAIAQPAQAQSIVPEAGSNTQVTPNGNQYDITGGNLSADQKNLFQNFSKFGLTQGEIANFLANPQLQNILGRINSADPSVINGLIQVTGGTPNLYLINPAGIIFGPNASLNVPAAFTATTANQVGFGAGNFNAIGPNDYTTLNGNPTSFTFSNLQPGTILNAGNLAVTSGQSLTLIGGTVVNTGTLTAPEGQITVTAVPGSNLVRLSQTGSLLNLEFQPIAPTTSSAPTLPQLLTGGNVPGATGVALNPDGSVRLTSTGTVIPTEAGSAIVAGAIDVSGSVGGSVNVIGSQVATVGAAIDASGTNGGGSVKIGGDYKGSGSIPNARLTVIDPTTTILANGGVSGDGGKVIIWSDDTTRFYGEIAATGGSLAGNGGFVEVSGKESLTYQGTANLLAPAGAAGSLLLDPAFIRIIDDIAGSGDLDGALPSITAATPDAGANTVSWGQLAAAATTGSVTLEATGDITFADIVGNTPLITTAGGNARLDLGATGQLIIRSVNGNVSFDDPTNTISTNGGSVLVSGNNLSLGNFNTSLITLTSPQGGNVTLNATGTVSVGDITTSIGFLSPGDGGDITINAGGNIVADDLTGNGYNPNAGGAAQGGTINVLSTAGTITLGDIQVEAFAANSSGGSVTLETLSLGGDIAFSSISARGTGGGAGGSATITATGLVRGYGVSTATGQTIATQGATTQGQVSIQHDGSVTNQNDFVVGGAVTATSGNGTVGGIQVSPGTVDLPPTQTIGFTPTPFTTAGNRIQITYANTAPVVTSSNPLPAIQTGQTLSFTLADLGLAVTDANQDTNITLQVGAIAPGATLTINGTPATAGSVIPPGAQFEFTPPAGFVGSLGSALTIVANDLLQTSTPLAVAVQVQATPPPPPSFDFDNANCALNQCTTAVNLPTPPTIPSTAILNPYPTFEERFTRQLESFLNLPNTEIQSTDEIQDVARRIQREVGVRPAFIYVGFVPPTLAAATVSEKTKEVNALKLEERPDDQLEVVLVTPTGTPVRKRIPEATREKVLAIARQFRIEVSDPRKTRSTSYLAPSQQLYRWILTPIEKDLQERGIQNLVFLMDLGLRALPLAALHDGNGFIIERYSVALMPSLSLTNTTYQNIRNSQVLSMGITESTGGQPALPGVYAEVTTVANRVWSGRLALNESVTPENLQAFRKEQPFGIVHLATHADFRPGSSDTSYIQFWNQRLNLEQMRDLGFNNPEVELLVLSACTTGVGDLEAELGFSGVAVQVGVKSAIASLWYINDASAVALITGFYQQLLSAPIKADALRQIQLSMAKGDVRLEGNQLVGLGIEGGVTLPAESMGIRDQVFSHPYYWSGFTLVGNPW